MVEDSSKKKPMGVRIGKSFKDVNRELRAKLSNINKNLLPGSKERKPQSMGSSKQSPIIAKPTTNQPTRKIPSVTAHSPPRSPVQVRKKDSVTRSQTNKKKTSSDTAGTRDQSNTSQSKEKRKKEESEEFSPPSSSSPSSERKKSPVKKPDQLKPKMRKIYTEKQLKKMIDRLYKQTEILRADDPSVDTLLKETRESIQAIEALEKLYHHVHEESKIRTKRLMDEFERLKTMRQQHARDIDSQIAQQVRTEVDNKKELEEILNDSNVKNLVAKPVGSKEEVEQQSSFVVNMLRGVFGL
ncbi:hypothetical protein RB195_004101 [Necator americanus]|uniref:Uncharacterized protein n=1 Tax=Necator americanus TaxID=51031 RepID=A0ABR1BGL8_NECAM